jgi:hypothetical protein
MKTTLISLVAGSLAAAAVSAGAAAAEVDGLLACSRISDSAPRLQCFDRAVAPLVQQASNGQAPAPAATPTRPTAPPPTVTPAPARPPVAAVTPPELGQEQLKSSVKPARETETLTARIASLGKGAQGTYLVTLDNGQVWRHEQGAQGEYLKVGDSVTIGRAALGSYRLTRDAGKSKNWIRVSRVR